MTNQEKIEKYIKEICKSCKNKKTNLCDIRVSQIDDVVRCQFYEREGKNK